MTRLTKDNVFNIMNNVRPVLVTDDKDKLDMIKQGDYVYSQYLDMIVIYKLASDNRKEMQQKVSDLRHTVTYSECRRLGIDVVDLIVTAIENMKNDGYRVIAVIDNDCVLPVVDDHPRMSDRIDRDAFVCALYDQMLVTNDWHVWGASIMLNMEMLSWFIDKGGYIIPITQHSVVISKGPRDAEVTEALKRIGAANREQFKDEAYVSESVYYFDGNEQRLYKED